MWTLTNKRAADRTGDVIRHSARDRTRAGLVGRGGEESVWGPPRCRQIASGRDGRPTYTFARVRRTHTRARRVTHHPITQYTSVRALAIRRTPRREIK